MKGDGIALTSQPLALYLGASRHLSTGSRTTPSFDGQNYAALANASRVIFSGPDAVATTLSSIRTPPKGLSSSTTVQSIWARREPACAAASRESIREIPG